MKGLLDPIRLPCFSALTADAVGPALDAALSAYQAVVDRLIAEKPTTFNEAWLPFERAGTAIDALWSAVAHLKSVADTPPLRAAHSAGQARLVEVMTRVAQNRDLYDLFVALTKTAAFAELPAADRVAVKRTVRDFRLSGVALEPRDRARFAEISVELSRLSTEFGSAVLDAIDAWSEHVTDETVLAGIPEPARQMFAAAARDKGLEQGWLITLHMPSVNAVLTFAEDRMLRARVYAAFGTRASDQGPNAGRFDNSARIARILELRREAATLLGFTDHVDWSLATKMARDAAEVLSFLRDLARRARVAAERELAELREFAARNLEIGELEPWDVAFTANRLRLALYSVDEQEVRSYFPIERVLEGWKQFLNRLFGLRLLPRSDVALWHEDARYYDVADKNGSVFAGVYLDLRARPHKQGGAWMAEARPRLRDGNTVRGPVAYLTCNFAPEGTGVPSLLSHADVVTLLHETGHCLHHLFTRVDRPSIGGISGFEWDAVEFPSQLMEDFAWDREVLTGMSGHYRTGEALPAELFERILVARHFHAGMLVLRQVELALYDIMLHRGALGSDPMKVLEVVRGEVAVICPPAWHRFPHAFSHIFAGAYASGYYSYLWAEVLAADAFQRFAAAGTVDCATGDALREEVLSRGASRPASVSFRAFRGRDPDPTALLARRGLMIRSTPHTITAALASKFTRIGLSHVTREYPNKLDHILTESSDLRSPRALHPIFFGSFDWHSCVHTYWLLARLYRRFPQLPEAERIGSLFDQQLSSEKVAGELAYLARPSAGTFERPYGWAWLLMLRAELLRHSSDEGRRWSSNLAPLAAEFARRFESYLRLATYPIRAGVHTNSAFALLLAHEYANMARNERLATLCADAAQRWYQLDKRCPAWEPSQDEFLSPSLMEAALMCNVLAHRAFNRWFSDFLPDAQRGLPTTLFAPAFVADRTDGKVVHLDGLNLSRAWCWRLIIQRIPDAGPLRERVESTIESHLLSSIEHVAGDYMGEHWLSTLALLALDPYPF
jgi:oligopeptidase A